MAKLRIKNQIISFFKISYGLSDLLNLKNSSRPSVKHIVLSYLCAAQAITTTPTIIYCLTI